MKHLTAFSGYLLYSKEQDDESHRKRKSLDANLEGIHAVSNLSPEAQSILAFMVEASNNAKCWVALDLDCPLFTRHVEARQELRARGLILIRADTHSSHIFLSELLQFQLVD